MEKTINATEKQISLMKKLGIYQPNLTMKEAGSNISVELIRMATDKEDNIEREPVKPEEQAEKKEVYDKHKVGTHIEKPETKLNGFKLTEENIRIGALTCAIEWLNKGGDREGLTQVTKDFEKYIRFGE